MAEPAGIDLSTATLGADRRRWQVAPVHDGSGFDRMRRTDGDPLAEMEM